MSIKKEIRHQVWLKYDKHCAYCGKELEYSQMQVDHIEAHWHAFSPEKCDSVGIKKGSDSIENYNPACARCNRWKSTMSIETFRSEIQQQVERLNRYSNQYRMASDFKLIEETGLPVVFYFER